MATTTQNFGTNTALTVTNLQSLGDASYWQSAVIDNGTVKATHAEVFITILTTTTAGDANGTIDLYYAGSTDGGTDFAGGATGSEGTYTDTGDVDPDNLQFIRSFPCDASETAARTYKYHCFLDYLSEDFALVICNNSGTGLGATTNAVEYRLNKYDTA